MAAGLGFKDFTTGEVLTAADVDGYLMQGVWVFADAAARTAAVTSPQEGNMSFLKDTNSTEYYSGSAWVAVGGTTPTWTTFTPTVSGVTAGNGTVVARYFKNGKAVNVFYQIILGSTSAITGIPSFATPTTPARTSFNAGQTTFQDTGNATYSGTVHIITGTAYSQALLANGTYVYAVNPSSTVPFTFGNGDIITMEFFYEEA